MLLHNLSWDYCYVGHKLLGHGPSVETSVFSGLLTSDSTVRSCEYVLLFASCWCGSFWDDLLLLAKHIRLLNDLFSVTSLARRWWLCTILFLYLIWWKCVPHFPRSWPYFGTLTIQIWNALLPIIGHVLTSRLASDTVWLDNLLTSYLILPLLIFHTSISLDGLRATNSTLGLRFAPEPSILFVRWYHLLKLLDNFRLFKFIMVLAHGISIHFLLM